MTDEKLGTVDETAGFLRVSRETVIRLLKKGDLKGVKVGNQWRIREKDLFLYLDGKVK